MLRALGSRTMLLHDIKIIGLSWLPGMFLTAMLWVINPRFVQEGLPLFVMTSLGLSVTYVVLLGGLKPRKELDFAPPPL